MICKIHHVHNNDSWWYFTMVGCSTWPLSPLSRLRNTFAECSSGLPVVVTALRYHGSKCYLVFCSLMCLSSVNPYFVFTLVTLISLLAKLTQINYRFIQPCTNLRIWEAWVIQSLKFFRLANLVYWKYCMRIIICNLSMVPHDTEATPYWRILFELVLAHYSVVSLVPFL